MSSSVGPSVSPNLETRSPLTQLEVLSSRSTALIAVCQGARLTLNLLVTDIDVDITSMVYNGKEAQDQVTLDFVGLNQILLIMIAFQSKHSQIVRCYGEWLL